MGQYDNLSDGEKRMLRRMGKASKDADTTSWVLVKSLGGTELLAVEGGQSLEDVPGADSFYHGLASKGFLSTSLTKQGSLEISLQQRAIEYADYASKSGLARWWKDRTDELAEDQTVWARVFWHVLTFGLGFLSAILLRLLGWM